MADYTLSASQLPDSLAALRLAIEKAVPHDRTSGGGRGDRGAWHTSHGAGNSRDHPAPWC